MSNIKLVIDSATDLPEEIINKHNIHIVQLNISFDEQDFTGISNRDFYEKMRIATNLPKTSAPSPERFMEQFSGEEDVIMVTLSHKLSSTYSTALLSKDLYFAENPPKNICIIDSGNGCIGSGLLVIKIAEMIEQGKTINEIEKKALDLRDNYLIHWGLLETLENAIKGGRVSRTKGIIANALNLKAIVDISNYLVNPADKAKGTKNGLKKVMDMVLKKMSEKNYSYTKLGIAHANAIERAELVKESMMKAFPFTEIVITEIGPLMGTYTSEGAVMIAVL